MPLHDHPGMTVFTKLLTGSAHIRVFSGPGSSILAEKVLDHDITKDSGAWVLFPDTGGNVHRFVAGEETYCAFLNVLTPSSSPPANQRRCSTFYKDIPYKPCRCALRSGLMEAMMHERERPLAWLEEVAKPRDLRIANLMYRGPAIF
nr:unnamed protein product [Digitaria exilis]